MEKDSDILLKYRAVTNKLKKRFLKKPNVAEGSEQFSSLAKTLKVQECPQYAGFCYLAQARLSWHCCLCNYMEGSVSVEGFTPRGLGRSCWPCFQHGPRRSIPGLEKCEHTLSNPAGEAQALMDAARSFLGAEQADTELKCPSFQEHLTASINCYSHAIRSFSKHGEATAHYQRAAELQSQSPLDCLAALNLVAQCKLETKDYEGALAVLTEMAYLAQERGGSSTTGKPIGAYCDVLAECEITRVLLLMLLQPTPQRIRPEHAQTLEKYAWESAEDNFTETYLGEDLFLLLQSVVMACQAKDLEALRALQSDLWPLLKAEQNQLLHLVIQELAHPSGEGV